MADSLSAKIGTSSNIRPHIRRAVWHGDDYPRSRIAICNEDFADGGGGD
jgi:hypothetical protein